jgi:cation:H+ antiporter
MAHLSLMENLLAAGMVVAGIALLGLGADLLVRGAVTLAQAAKVSAAVIGLTIVSMGTSLPELTVSVAAALRGSPDLSMGNVVGSNIFNIGLVLGVSALILPMRVHGSAVKMEWPFLFGASLLLLVVARDGTLDRAEGGFFVIALALFTAYAFIIGRATLDREEKEDLAAQVRELTLPVGVRKLGVALGLLAVGTAVLVSGGELLVRGAISLARAIGMTERLIGLTVVAAGTGAPELATSVVAARRGESEMALGNVIGSNIFNILGILGVSALITPLAVAPAILRNDLWWMLGLTLLLFPIMRSRFLVTRVEGGLLLFAYVAYVSLLVINR